jgi:hypothetical protein
MQRAALFTLTVVLILALALSGAFAGDNPAPRSGNQQVQGPPLSPAQQKLFYGYVPPPPIRETWPGGYRLIMHELTNILLEHITGHY